MFIESLEFTIPVDLCSLCSTLQKGSLSDLEFPASVNSYGTTQDASIQVALRANKLTFKVDGVSSNASIISKSECKTLKLSVFDVDRSLIPQENIDFSSSNVSHLHHPSPVSNIGKRTFDHISDSSTPIGAKIRRNSHDSNRRKNKSPTSGHASDHTNHQSKQQTSNDVIVKTEPEDPDLIEIEPDPEPIKTEDPQIQTDNSVNVYPQLSQSSTSSFERNVPHVPDYAEASTSHHRHGNQSADDFLVFQDDTYDGEDNEGDYSNDGGYTEMLHGNNAVSLPESNWRATVGGHIDLNTSDIKPIGDALRSSLSELSMCFDTDQNSVMHRLQTDLLSNTVTENKFPCGYCSKMFATQNARKYHYESVHEKKTFSCICGKVYKYHPGLFRHIKDCPIYLMANKNQTNMQPVGNN